MPHLSSRYIGVIGDVHGNTATALNAITVLGQRGITEMHFLGDFGFVWRDDQEFQSKLKRLQLALDEFNATLFVTGGNHENYDLVLSFDADADGIRWVRNRIGFLPRGWRASTPSGQTIASLGGANSIDRYSRTAGVGWWWQESITEADLDRLGQNHADILISHDSPRSALLDRKLLPNQRLWSVAGLNYAQAGQAVFHRGFQAVTPKLSIGGHYHFALDTTESFQTADGAVFESHIVILNSDGKPNSVAILDTSTLELEFLNLAVREERLRLGRERR